MRKRKNSVVFPQHIFTSVLFFQLCLQTEACDNEEQCLMHHLKYFQQIEHEKRSLRQRINEFSQWIRQHDVLHKKFSLNQSKFDQQILDYRQLYSDFRTKYDRLKSTILFDDHDKQYLKSLDEYFHCLTQQTDRINSLTISFNDFLHEHANLINTYAKLIRFYSKEIDWNLSSFEPVDHSKYNQVRSQLIDNDLIEDSTEIFEYDQQIDEYRKQYQIFIDDLQILIERRRSIFIRYETVRTQIELWCQSIDHEDPPSIDPLINATRDLVEFLRSIENLGLSNDKHSFCEKQTKDLIERYYLIRQYQQMKSLAEKLLLLAKNSVNRNENLLLPLDKHSAEILLDKFQVKYSQIISKINIFVLCSNRISLNNLNLILRQLLNTNPVG